jgi:dihydroxy-acid dehydratase
MTRKAFDNAITVIMVLGGSTNAVLHLIAMARSVGVSLTQDDFQAISNKIPVLADFKPSGKYLMQDLHQHGGIPAVMKYLLEKGLLHGDCLTVTGKTLAENLKDIPSSTSKNRISSTRWKNPSKPPATCRSSTATWPQAAA